MRKQENLARNRTYQKTNTRGANEKYWRDKIDGNQVVDILKATTAIACGIANGNYPVSQFMCGPPGIGKTTIFRRAFVAARRPHRVIKSATKLGLLDELSRAADRRVIALVDDADKIWHDAECLQVLMAATAPAKEGTRVYTHSTAHKSRDYCFDGLTSVIISNIDLTDAQQFSGRIRHSIAALISRIPPVVLRANHEDVYEYTAYLAVCNRLLREYPLNIANDALDFLARHRHKMNDVSPRRLQLIAERRAEVPDYWDVLLKASFDRQPRGEQPDLSVIPQIVL